MCFAALAGFKVMCSPSSAPRSNMGAATTQHDGHVIPGVTAEPKLRHSRSSRRTQTSSFRAQSRNPSPAYQRINQKIQRPLRSNMGAATTQHDGLVIPGVTAEPKLRHSRSSRRTQTSSFRAQSRNPSPAYQRINQKIQRPLRSNMGAATTQHDGAGPHSSPIPFIGHLSRVIQRDPEHITLNLETASRLNRTLAAHCVLLANRVSRWLHRRCASGHESQALSNRRVSTNSRWPRASAAVRRPLMVRIMVSSSWSPV